MAWARSRSTGRERDQGLLSLWWRMWPAHTPGATQGQAPVSRKGDSTHSLTSENIPAFAVLDLGPMLKLFQAFSLL